MAYALHFDQNLWYLDTIFGDLVIFWLFLLLAVSKGYLLCMFFSEHQKCWASLATLILFSVLFWSKCEVMITLFKKVRGLTCDFVCFSVPKTAYAHFFLRLGTIFYFDHPLPLL